MFDIQFVQLLFVTEKLLKRRTISLSSSTSCVPPVFIPPGFISFHMESYVVVFWKYSKYFLTK
uniref:Uncharacterized protein n=1 Tax=Octopus bimaculoides TaxID=37653 RepID=A0A0L8GI80_OCTBM